MTLIDWAGGWVIWESLLFVGLLVLVYFAWQRKASVVEFSMQRKSSLLTVAERRFFQCLTTALSDEYYVFTRIRMLDVVRPDPSMNLSGKRRLEQTLSMECLDFVLCKKNDLSIFGVVELENFEKRSGAKGFAQREKLICEVCKIANLRLFYFDVRQDYQGMDIRRLVTGRVCPDGQGQWPIDQSLYNRSVG